MPLYTIETTYRLPHFRQRTFEAPTPEAAYRLTFEGEDWDGDSCDYETAGETYVTGVCLPRRGATMMTTSSVQQERVLV